MKEHGAYLAPTVYVARLLSEMATTRPEKLPPNIVAKIKIIAPIIQAMFAAAHRAGVKIAFGTDTFGNFRSGTTAKEFAEMVRLGMPPMDALTSATMSAADLIGVSEEIGSIQPGRYADIIAVAGNPMQDITELERVQFVMKGGVVYKANGVEVVERDINQTARVSSGARRSLRWRAKRWRVLNGHARHRFPKHVAAIWFAATTPTYTWPTIWTRTSRATSSRAATVAGTPFILTQTHKWN